MGLFDQKVNSALQVGEAAPDFTLPTQNGTNVSLSEYRGKRAVVLYFYPKDDTPGCTAEACGFRDSYETFTDAGAEVIGVSADSLSSHREFARRYKLPFVLVSDSGGSLRKRYGVPSTFGVMPGRVTYVIDKQGIVRHIFSSQFMPQQHITEALHVLQQTGTPAT